jgi:5'-nucleotidase
MAGRVFTCRSSGVRPRASTVGRVRILVTNDDGIDSIGLHKLACAVVPFGEVTVVAPDREYSGASAAFGAIHLSRPEVHRTSIPDGDGLHAVWAVAGPPALCVMFARLGAFGDPFDLVVSGINPGANVGRSVYHSGTIGAALTGRNAGWTSVAISQAVKEGGVEGQAWDELLEHQLWDSAATVAETIVAGLVADMPAAPQCLNVNVPNLPVEEIKGWKRTTVGVLPARPMRVIGLEPKHGHDGTFNVKMDWGDAVELPIETDGGAVQAGYVSVTWINRLHEMDPGADAAAAEKALDALVD